MGAALCEGTGSVVEKNISPKEVEKNYEKNKSDLFAKMNEILNDGQKEQNIETKIKDINVYSIDFIEKIKSESISYLKGQREELHKKILSAQDYLVNLHNKIKEKKEYDPQNEFQKLNEELLNEIRNEINQKEEEYKKIINKNRKAGQIYRKSVIKLMNDIEKDNTNIIKNNSKYYFDINKSYEQYSYVLSTDVNFRDKSKKENCSLFFQINQTFDKLENDFNTKIEKIKRQTENKNHKIEEKTKGEVNEVLEVYIKKCKEEKLTLINLITDLIKENEALIENKKNIYVDKINNKLDEIRKNYNNIGEKVDGTWINKNEFYQKRKEDYGKRYKNIGDSLVNANQIRVEKIKEKVTKEIMEIREKNKNRLIDKENYNEKVTFGETKQIDNELLKELNDNNDICPIDNEIYLINQYIIYCPCGHKYHIACISEWLKVHNTCPICRKNIK